MYKTGLQGLYFVNQDNKSMEKTQRLVSRLVWGGLLPFVASAILTLSQESVAGLSTRFIFVSYSALILSFLAGILWGRGFNLESKRIDSDKLIYSNLFSLLAWSTLLLVEAYFAVTLLLLSVGYFLVLAFEQRQNCDGWSDYWYLVLRIRVTFAVVGIHLIVLSQCLFQ